MHQRFAPQRHGFVYRIFMLGIDLDELAEVGRGCHLLAINRKGFFSWREEDYLPVSETPPSGERAALKQRVLDHLRRHGIDLPSGARVQLVTMPRVAGYSFNPVSFYFCDDGAGRAVAAIVEVTNTFREVKPFLLPPTALVDGVFRLRLPKYFYVSPYSDVDVAFDFTLRPPGERISVQIDDYIGDERTLTSTVAGAARPLRDLTLAWFAFKYPFLSLRVIALIHGHAFLLYLKRVPWFRMAARAADQRELYRPA